MKQHCKTFLAFICLTFIASLIGCGGGGGGGGSYVAPIGVSLSGSVALPNDTAENITKNVVGSVSYSGMKVYLLDTNDNDIVSPVGLGSTGGFFFPDVPAGNNYQLIVVTPSGKKLLRKHIDSFSVTKSAVSIDSVSTALAILVKQSNFEKSEAKLAEVVTQAVLSNLAEKITGWLEGNSPSTENDVFAVVIEAVGESEIKKIIDSIPDAAVYSVVYDGNGNTTGTVPIDNLSYQPNTTVTIKENIGNLAKTGYTFAGWNTAADGSGFNYSSKSTFAIGIENVTLYAKWTKNPTQVSGTIMANTTWSLASSPYELTNRVQIAKGYTLTIEPGVVVNAVAVNGNTQSIEVFGNLRAVGNVNNRITLKNIRIASGIESGNAFYFFIDLDYVNLSGSLYAGTPFGLHAAGSVNLRNSVVSGENKVCVVRPSRDCVIERNIFKNLAGILVETTENAQVYIQNNVFFGAAVEVGSSLGTSQTIVRYNSFLGNHNKTLNLPVSYRGCTDDMIATDNFWNTTNPSEIASMIFDKNDDLSSPNIIEFEPFLSAPHQDTPDPTPYL